MTHSDKQLSGDPSSKRAREEDLPATKPEPKKKRNTRRQILSENDDDVEETKKSNRSATAELKKQRIPLTTSIADDETRKTIEELNKSRSNLRAIGKDPLQEVLEKANEAKLQKSQQQQKKSKSIAEQEPAAEAMPSPRKMPRKFRRNVVPTDLNEDYERMLLGESDDPKPITTTAGKENEAPASGKEKKGKAEEKKVEEEEGPKQNFTQRQPGAKKVEWDSQDEIEDESQVKHVNPGAQVLGEKREKPVKGGKREVNLRSGRRKKMAWTEKEATILVDLVEQYGKGKWKKILLEGRDMEGGPFFVDRTAVDLKDKFRNLEKYAMSCL